MKYRLLWSLLPLLFVVGCSDGPKVSDPSSRIAHASETSIPSAFTEEERFKHVMASLVAKIKANPNYRKIGLQTAQEKQWFKNLLYKLWHRDITRREFIARGVERYPSKRYEFTFIADAMQTI